MLSQTNQQHLHQSALDWPVKDGVQLDTIADNDMVRLKSVAVEVDIDAFGRLAYDDGVHARQDRAATCLLGYAQCRKDVCLAFCGSAAMAAHRGDNERLCPELPYMVDDPFSDLRNVGDASTARGNRNPVPGRHAIRQVQLAQLCSDGRRDVVDASLGKALLSFEQLG